MIHQCGILSLAWLTVAAAAPPCLTPESLFDINGISDPQTLPSEGREAFVYSWHDKSKDTTYSHIRIGKHGTFQSLHGGDIHEHTPRFSPDGKWLVYLSDRDGQSRLRLRSLADDSERVLDLGGRLPGNLKWSPDSRWLAFTAYQETEPEWNPEIPQAPPGATWAPKPLVVTTMRYAMDGSGLMKPGSVRLFALSIAEGNVVQVSRLPYWHTSYLSGPELTWQSDSRALIAPAVKAADGWRVFDESVLYVFPLDGGQPQRLGQPNWYQSQAVVIGEKIAFAGFAWKGQSYHVSQLWVKDTADATPRSLTPNLDRDATQLKWAADGSGVYFLSDDHGDINLYFAPVSGTLRQITKGTHRISSYSLGAAGKALAIVSTPRNAALLVEISLADGTQKVLSDPNPAHAKCSLALPEEVRYRATDGREIQGWVLKPAGFESGKKYPMIVAIHGGPHASYGNNFQADLQIFAQRGYVVFYSNPRGSTGYGEEFARIIQHRWPGEDINDVLTGVDEVAKKGFVDTGRMAVIGGSGGGLMTSWMVTQTHQFKAAVAWWPVTNWITHVGVGDNGFYISSVYRKAMPWENPDDYIKHSPLFHVAKVRTPTMVICGDADWRVPIAQSEEFYRALKVRNVPTVFIRYPDESHGSSKKTSHRMSVLAHSLAWIDRYTAK